MGRAYFIAAGVGLALCVAFPPLLPFVLVGIVAGLLPRFFRRPLNGRPSAHPHPPQADRHSLRGWIAVTGAIAFVGSLLGLGVAVLSILPHGGAPEPHGGSGVTIEIPVRYEGRGTYEDDPEQLLLDDRVTVSFDDLRSAVEDYRLLRELEPSTRPESRPLPPGPEPLSAARLERILASRLGAEGWSLARRSTEGSTFAKRRRVPLRSRIFPIETGNEIPLPHFDEDAPAGAVRLETQFGEASEMVLVAPTWTFDSTRPASDREELLASDLEERQVPVEASTTVEVEVRSPWFRSGIVRSGVDWVLSGGKYLLGILLGLLIAVLSEPIKEWIRRRLKIPKGTAG